MKPNFNFSNRVRNPYLGRIEESQKMGRIIASVTIDNVSDPAKSIKCDALVDTGASFMVLPSAWRDRLGQLETTTEIEMETATQETILGDVAGPVRIQIEGFRPIYSEVSFVDMHPANGEYEPLIGYLVLEQSQAAVDMLGHRLVQVKRWI
jgi:predicted aspartyl protease